MYCSTYWSMGSGVAIVAGMPSPFFAAGCWSTYPADRCRSTKAPHRSGVLTGTGCSPSHRRRQYCFTGVLE